MASGFKPLVIQELQFFSRFTNLGRENAPTVD